MRLSADPQESENEGRAINTAPLGVIVNGATGRMGYRRHLVRSLPAVRDNGGLRLSDGEAGKGVHTERPLGESTEGALAPAHAARAAGVRNGVAHDKLHLPGLVKLKRLVDDGYIGRILSMRGDVVVDRCHVRWDPAVEAQIARAGRRVASFQVRDRITPLPAGTLLSRGMPGDGHIDVRQLSACVDAVGCTGDSEVEISNADVRAAHPDTVVTTMPDCCLADVLQPADRPEGGQ
ncbi:hypothetical protein [Peterkaempfera sp. SMS 1(5)a]|uniref:hypothetical protein n=1 Tax=Peterkaempfera podocarpi TaxID=3232308 RepID=UPI00366FD647